MLLYFFFVRNYQFKMANEDQRTRDLKDLISSGLVREAAAVVVLPGPDGSPYYGWQWNVRLTVPEEYPAGLPSIVFLSTIYQPNVNIETGLVSMNLLPSLYSTDFGLLPVFLGVLPHLLMHPHVENEHVRVNEEAAALFTGNPDGFRQRAIEYCDLYADIAEVQEPANVPEEPVEELINNDAPRISSDEDIDHVGQTGDEQGSETGGEESINDDAPSISSNTDIVNVGQTGDEQGSETRGDNEDEQNCSGEYPPPPPTVEERSTVTVDNSSSSTGCCGCWPCRSHKTSQGNHWIIT